MTPFVRATRVQTIEQMVARIVGRGYPIEDAREAVALAMRGEVWKNDVYQVVIDKEITHGFGDDIPLWHLSIKRIDQQPVHDWRDLQAIKDELVGASCEAIELYPAHDRTLDVANQYHLYACPDCQVRFPFGMFGPRSVGTPEEAAALGAKQRPHES